jgi:apolipoprotein N-acyltransferase
MSSGTPVMQAEEVLPASAAPAPRSAWLPCLLAAGLSGGLLYACYYPLALGWCLGWIALVPLLTLVRAQARPRVLYLSAYCGGACFFAPALLWMPVADPRMYATWAMLWVYCALYFPLALALLRWLDRNTRLPLVVIAPIVWSALEYFRSWFATGFSWYFLGHTQQAVLPMIQIADLGGVFAVSFVVVAVNAVLCDVLYQLPLTRQALRLRPPATLDNYASLEMFKRGFFAELAFRRNLLPEAFFVILLLGGVYAYGLARLSQNHFEAGPTIALLQGNLDQRLRNNAGDGDGDARQTARGTIAGHYARLCKRALTFPAPHLIVWPETSYPQEWYEVSPRLPAEKVPTAWRDAEVEVREHLRTVAEICPTHHLIGMTASVLDAEAHHRRYNTALYLTPQGRVEDRFDKMHRIPFGEYVPLRDWLPFMNRFAPYDFDYSIAPGEKFTRFALGPYRFGVLICYEDTDAPLARHYARAEKEGPAVDFLINISNDGWFDGSSEHDEHLAVSRFRAIECRRALARSVNMGISALIDGNGRILQPHPVRPDPKDPNAAPLWSVGDEPGQVVEELPPAGWATFKKVGLVLKVVVPIDRRGSLYAQYGDWLPQGCWLFLGGAALAVWSGRRKAAVIRDAALRP